MKIYRNGDVRIAFVHIPKTGGSSVKKFLEQSYELIDRSHPICNHITSVHYLKKFNPKDYDFTFTIYRDPIKRFVSHYKWRESAANERRSIDVFTRSILTQYRTFKSVNDNHIIPQHEYLCEGIYIYNFDNLIEVPSLIERDSGIKIIGEFPHLKKMKYNESDILSPTSLEIVKEFYKKDFDIKCS